MLDRIGVGPLVINESHPLNRGRVAWWLALPGTNYGGARWLDLMGSNHGTLTSGPAWGGTSRPGGTGQIRFDGSGSYVDCGNAAALNITGAITVSCWLLMANPALNSIFVAKDNNTGGRAYTLDISSGDPRFYINGGAAGAIVVSSAGVAASTWTHVAATFAPGSALKIYINGVANATAALTDSAIPTATTSLRIGARAYSGSEGFLTGSLDDATAYNRALSAAEVRALYDLSRRGYPGLLVRAGWPAATPAAAGPAFVADLPYVLRQAVKRSASY